MKGPIGPRNSSCLARKCGSTPEAQDNHSISGKSHADVCGVAIITTTGSGGGGSPAIVHPRIASALAPIARLSMAMDPTRA